MTYGNYPDLKKVKRILVVKLRHHGDVLLTSPVFSNLKKKLPHAAIDAYVYRDTLPMLEGHPAIADFLQYDRAWKQLPLWRRLLKEAALLRNLRSRGYDLVLNLTEGDRGAIAARFSGAPIRVGFDPQNKGFKGKKKIYTHVAKVCSNPRHTVERQLDVLRCMGIFPAEQERDLFFAIPEASHEKVQGLLGGKSEYLLLHAVSRWRFKCPSPLQMAQLLTLLHQKGYPLVLSGSPDPQELAMVEEILRLAPQVPVLNLAGKTTLKELGALIQKSRCLITVDSVPLHIASALKTPVVALFGPSSEMQWGPWRHPRAHVVAQKTSCRPCFMDGCGGSKMSDCLFTLPVSSIIEAVRELI